MNESKKRLISHPEHQLHCIVWLLSVDDFYEQNFIESMLDDIDLSSCVHLFVTSTS